MSRVVPLPTSNTVVDNTVAIINADGSVASIAGDATGLVTQPGLSSTNWQYAAAASGIANTTTAVTIKTAGAAGVRNCISSLQLFAGALGAGTEVAVRDGAGGTVLWRGFVSTAGANIAVHFPVPLIGTAATLLEVVTLTATITGAVYFNAQGFTRT